MTNRRNSFRLTEDDVANERAIAEAIAREQGTPFVNRSEVIRRALAVAAEAITKAKAVNGTGA